MYIFLIVVHLIACIVLVLTILMQSGRGGGLSESFGSSSTATIFGTSASNFLQKATSVCAIVFLLTSLSLAVLSSRKSRSLMQLDKIRQVLPQAQREVLPGELPDAIPAEGVETAADEVEGAPVEAPAAE
jgi:preprotein translocase subunit SecG